MFFKNLFKKKTEEKIEKIGEEIPFKVLDEETMEYHENRIWRVLREKEGKKYWENMKPYEIIDENLCIRICDSFYSSTYGGWMVLSKEKLKDILSKM